MSILLRSNAPLLPAFLICASMNLKEMLRLLSKSFAFNHGERAMRVQSTVNGQTQFSCELHLQQE
jgi:hypothetical protein